MLYAFVLNMPLICRLSLPKLRMGKWFVISFITRPAVFIA
jgi:hypothetical protein